MDLSSKVVLITGAKGGLGTFVTNAFLDSGANVVGVSRSIQSSDFEHPQFTPLPAELSSAAAAESVISQTVDRFGYIHAVVHLLGGYSSGSVADTDEAGLEKMFDLNFRPAFHVFRAAIPHMRRQGSGRLLAIGTRAAVEPAANLAAYTASKAALISLVRSAAMENKDRGITANVLLPGAMDTPQNRTAMPTADFSKWVSPAAVASLLVWLTSGHGAHVSGAAIPVYGGEL